MRKFLLIFLIITSISIVGCSSGNGNHGNTDINNQAGENNTGNQTGGNNNSGNQAGGNNNSGNQTGGTTDDNVDITYENTKVKSVKTSLRGTTYAIMTNGELYAWGDNEFGQIGNGSIQDASKPQLVKVDGAPLIVKSIEISDSFYDNVYAITTDNKLYSWGSNYYGQVGNGKSGENELQSTPFLIKDKNGNPISVDSVNAVRGSAGESSITIYLLSTDNKLYAWGKNDDGQVGNGNTIYQTTPQLIKENIKSVVAIDDVTTVFAIDTSNQLYAWGYNGDGQIANGVRVNQTSPSLVKYEETPLTVKFVTTSDYDTVYAISQDDKLYTWGNNSGRIGNGELEGTQFTPFLVKYNDSPLTVKSVFMKSATVYAVGKNDKLYAWGWNENGETGNGTTTNNQTKPYEVLYNTSAILTKNVSFGYPKHDVTVYTISQDDKLYTWGENYNGQVGNGEKSEVVASPYLVKHNETEINVSSVISTNNQVFVISTDKKLYSWGDNSKGELGIGNTTTQLKPELVNIISITNVYFKQSYSNYIIYATTQDNKLYYWGNYANGDYKMAPTLARVEGSQLKVKSLTVDNSAVYAITTDDELYNLDDIENPTLVFK